MGRKVLGNKIITVTLELELNEKIRTYAEKEKMLISRFVEKLVMENTPDFQSLEPFFFGRNRQRKAVGITMSPAGCQKIQDWREQYNVTKEIIIAALMANYEKLNDNGTKQSQ